MALSPSLAVAPSARLVDHTRHQTALRLLPFLFVLYVTNYLDRTSLAYAAIGMRRDLGFSDAVTGFAIGVFFISYVALQIPGALLVERWSARGIISITLVVWGTMTALTALVHTPLQLYAARFLPRRDRLPESLVPSGRSWESYKQFYVSDPGFFRSWFAARWLDSWAKLALLRWLALAVRFGRNASNCPGRGCLFFSDGLATTREVADRGAACLARIEPARRAPNQSKSDAGASGIALSNRLGCDRDLHLLQLYLL